MSRFAPVNPKPFLSDLQGKQVVVCLKWGQEYRGLLQSFDAYFNVQLLDTEEFQDGRSTGILGEVMIRCNNVLWISAEPDIVATQAVAQPGEEEQGQVQEEDEEMQS